MKKVISAILCFICSVGLIFSQNSSIQIMSDPGISVYLNGQYTGITNVELKGLIIENLDAGGYSLKFTKEGFNPQGDSILLKEGETKVYTVKPFTPVIKVRLPFSEPEKIINQNSASTQNQNLTTDQANPNNYQDPQDSLIFMVVESMPEYPGGEAALYRFLKENIQYPEAARKKRIQGRVFVTFVIEQDGSVTNVELLKGIGGGCDEETIRVVKAMPKWIPGKQRGKYVRVQYNLPVMFSKKPRD